MCKYPSQLRSLKVPMIEVINLDLLHNLFPFKFSFRVMLGWFRFANRIVEFLAFTWYPVRCIITGERLKFTGRIGLLFTRDVCLHFGVVRTLSLLQLYLVHLVLSAAVYVLWLFPSKTAPEWSRGRAF